MQQGGSQYGMSPEMTPFSTSATATAATTTTTAATTRTHMLGLSTPSASSADHHHHHLPQQQQHPPHPHLHHQSSAAAAADVAEAASPISSRPPPPPSAAAAVGRPSGNFDELVAVSASGGFGDDDGLGGEEADRGVSGGNRWPRQETLALLKIRSEMDAAFRDATLKGPLWEDVSRKLAEQGYIRSAKKCKEKFENVHKYYKRTKEGRAGRQDGKSYRFFSQLEALHTSSAAANPPVNLAATPVSIGISMVAPGSSSRMQTPPPDLPTAAAAPQNIPTVPRIGPPDSGPPGLPPVASGSTVAAGGISFSSNTSSSASDSEDDLEGAHGRKRKRGPGGEGSSSSSSRSRKMMEFFEGLMKQVMEKQEAMQQRFLEAIEKREQDRMIREEAWKRQEMARLSREHDLMAQERAISASRDAAIITFLQKITGQTIQLPPAVVIPAAPPPQPTPPPPPTQAPPPPQQQHQPQPQHHYPPPSTEIVRHQNPSSEIVVAAVPEQQHPPLEMIVVGSGGSAGFDPTSSRWPKAEVLALIKLRSGLESRYQEAGPKGPLWEEISSGMQRMGYNRSAKRCKEKWENINKYFKKVKESNKKRPEDAKTCPYFHQLDALYRKKMGVGTTSSTQNRQEQQMIEPATTAAAMDAPNVPPTSASAAPLPLLTQPQATEAESKKNESSKNAGNMEAQPGGNEGLFEEGSSGGRGAKKPEDIMKELLGHGRQQEASPVVVMDDYGDKLEVEAADSDNIDQEEEEDDDIEEEDDDGEETEEEERKMGYGIQFQPRQNAGSSNGGGSAAATNSFLAMVHQ